jgi:Ca-activated chloride channel family protein
MPEKDLYEILEISPLATLEAIKQAHRALARRYHPDSGGEEASATRFQEVQTAYEQLSDPLQRRAYDRQRAERLSSCSLSFSWEILTSRQEMPAIMEEQVLYLLVNIKPTQEAEGQRLPINLALVIDRSTSMQGRRLDYVKAAAHQIVDELKDFDSLSVVTFGDRAEIVVPSQKLSDPHRVQARISAIWAEGGTEIYQGISKGLEQIRRYHDKETTSHLLLLTDGQTYGDDEDCIEASQQAGDQHIVISTLGIGENWNDTLLETMARRAGGNCYYISHPRQLRHVLEQYIRGLYGIVARETELTLRTAEGVTLTDAFRCFPSIDRILHEEGVLDLGLLRSDGRIQVLMEIAVGSRPAGQHRLFQVELSGISPTSNKRERLISDFEVDFTENLEMDPVPTAIINVMNRINLYRMQERAWTALNSGQRVEASQRLEAVATRLLDLGETDLAHVALLEASRVIHRGRASTKGEKTIKFGTRYLGMR